MSSGEIYTPKFEIVDVLKALKKVKIDELIPREPIFDFFYENSHTPGVSLFLRYKNKIKFFYVDHDDFILELKDQKPDWDISFDNNIIRVLFLYKVNNEVVSISFVFDLSKKEYRDLLHAIRKTREIKLYYLTVLYGGLVLDSYTRLQVPSTIVTALKKLK